MLFGGFPLTEGFFFFQDILRTEDVSRGFPTDKGDFPGYSEDSWWCPGDSPLTDRDVLRNSEGTRFYLRFSPPEGHGFPGIPHQGKVVSIGFPMDTW